MERVTFRNARNLTLVGNLYEASTDTIILLCHGFMSSKYSKGRFQKLATLFNQAGFSALAFDFSGCGESEEDVLTVAKEVEDLKAALSYAKARGYKKIALYGHSLGTLICLKGYTEEIITMVLSGALTGAMHYDWQEFFTKEQLQELDETGYLTEYTPEESGKKTVLCKQTLLDFEEINQQELLTPIVCPVLLIHGNRGEEENLLCERSKKAMSFLSKDSRLEIIEGADHSFLTHFESLSTLVKEWFEKHLSL